MNNPSAAAMPPYRTLAIDTDCCSSTIPHARIAEMSNEMAGLGYKLLQVYIDVQPTCGDLPPVS